MTVFLLSSLITKKNRIRKVLKRKGNCIFRNPLNANIIKKPDRKSETKKLFLLLPTSVVQVICVSIRLWHGWGRGHPGFFAFLGISYLGLGCMSCAENWYVRCSRTNFQLLGRRVEWAAHLRFSLYQGYYRQFSPEWG